MDARWSIYSEHWLIDTWTPVGMLSMNLTDSLEIRGGNLWQDWHIAPLKP